mgnify:CR=1 FL=1
MYVWTFQCNHSGQSCFIIFYVLKFLPCLLSEMNEKNRSLYVLELDFIALHFLNNNVCTEFDLTICLKTEPGFMTSKCEFYQLQLTRWNLSIPVELEKAELILVTDILQYLTRKRKFFFWISLSNLVQAGHTNSFKFVNLSLKYIQSVKSNNHQNLILA